MDVCSDITFCDTETIGLDVEAPIWEFAAIRRTQHQHSNGAYQETPYHCLIEHKPNPWLKNLPDEFKVDYLKRYRTADKILSPRDALKLIVTATAGAHIVGAVPNFDTERIARMMRTADIEPSWHYHLIDVENLIVGYLRAKCVGLPKEILPAFTALTTPPWNSDDLSHAVGVNPDAYKRHTAMGDVEWVRDQYDAVMRNVEAI